VGAVYAVCWPRFFGPRVAKSGLYDRAGPLNLKLHSIGENILKKRDCGSKSDFTMSRQGSLRFAFSLIPEDGFDFDFEERFQQLKPKSATEAQVLAEFFPYPISGNLQVFKVGSKVDVRGQYQTTVQVPCDRCGRAIEFSLGGDLCTFLMPINQFSKHDKPGGRVIHGKIDAETGLRHRSRTKAPPTQLKEAEGEHEDLRFGAFDGVFIDLRPLLWEELVLQLPMKNICGQKDCEMRPLPGEEAGFTDSVLAEKLSRRLRETD